MRNQDQLPSMVLSSSPFSPLSSLSAPALTSPLPPALMLIPAEVLCPGRIDRHFQPHALLQEERTEQGDEHDRVVASMQKVGSESHIHQLQPQPTPKSNR